MSDKMMEALEPCPFCGSEGQTLLRGVRYPEGSADKEGAVMCPTCEARAPLKAWNMRPPTPSRPVTAGSLPPTQEYFLRAMATNYAGGHSWDHLDGQTCVMAADEIAALRAALASTVTPQDGRADIEELANIYLLGRGMAQSSIDQIREYQGETWLKACDLARALAPKGAA